MGTLGITFFKAREAYKLTFRPHNRANDVHQTPFKRHERSIVQYCIAERAGQEFKFLLCTLSNLLPKKNDNFRSLSRSSDLKFACQNVKHYSGCYATNYELILAQFEPMYEIKANPTKVHFSPLFQFWVKM